jgi:hypothetical protein
VAGYLSESILSYCSSALSSLQWVDINYEPADMINGMRVLNIETEK